MQVIYTHNKIVAGAKNSPVSPGKKSQSAMKYLELLKNVSSKSQSAMEYLMTYGWAILIIAVVLVALFQLGVFNGSNFAPNAQAGACQVFKTTATTTLEGTCNNMLPQFITSFTGNYGDIQTPSLGSISTGFTASAWIYIRGPPTPSNCDEEIMSSFDTNPGGGTPGFDFNGYGCRGPVYLNGCCTSNNIVSWPSGIGFPLKTWEYVAITYTQASGNVLVYLNGQIYQTATLASDLQASSSSSAFNIGNAGWFEPTNLFNGSIANVQVYNTTISANEILALYQEGIGGVPYNVQNLIGWWPLNGNLNDYSGNNKNGADVGSNVIYTGSWESGYSQP